MGEEVNKITIIGCGPGGADYLTPVARSQALSMDILAGAARLFELFPEFKGRKIFYKGTAELLDEIAAASGRVGVLVSGDVTCFSLAESIIKRFERENCRLISGISSVQVALARFGLRLDTTCIISAHAGIPQITVHELLKEETVLLLGGNSESCEWIISFAELAAAEFAINICIDLTLDTEQVLTLHNPSAKELAAYLQYPRIILIFCRRADSIEVE